MPKFKHSTLSEGLVLLYVNVLIAPSGNWLTSYKCMSPLILCTNFLFPVSENAYKFMMSLMTHRMRILNICKLLYFVHPVCQMRHLPSKEVVVALTAAKEHLSRKRKVPSNFTAEEGRTVDKTTNEVGSFSWKRHSIIFIIMCIIHFVFHMLLLSALLPYFCHFFNLQYVAVGETASLSHLYSQLEELVLITVHSGHKRNKGKKESKK